MFWKEKLDRPHVAAVIAAAGRASRMNGLDKLFEELMDAPVIVHTMQALTYSDWIDEAVIVTRPEAIPMMLELIHAYGIPKIRSVVAGGETRQQSVLRGLDAVSEQTAYVAIHDGARPLVGQQVIADAVISAIRYGAAAAAVPVVDTIKVADADKRIARTPDRSTLYAVQTPQVFLLDAYREAARAAGAAGKDYTDDCQMMEAVGQGVYLSGGDYANLKITTPVDLAVARAIMEQAEEMLR